MRMQFDDEDEDACRAQNDQRVQGMDPGSVAHLIRSSDLELRVEVRGRGPAVLLHPSLGRSAADFHDLSARLAAADFTAVGINPRGVSGSVGELDGLTLHDLANDMWIAADALGIGRCHLLGHAFGNRVARCAAEDRPERVLSITLLAAGGQVPGQPHAISALQQVFDSSLTAAEHAAAVGTALFAPGRDPTPWLDGWHPAAAMAQGAAGSRTRSSDWQRGGSAPMLIVQGESDLIAPRANGVQLQQSRPGSRLVDIPHAGHALLPEQPDAVAGAVTAFLTSN